MCIPFSYKVVNLIMNLISGIHHSCERREYTFICTLKLLNNHSFLLHGAFKSSKFSHLLKGSLGNLIYFYERGKTLNNVPLKS